MEIGFIGLGKMGFPMARRLIEAGHKLTVFDTQKAAVDRLVALGARAGASPKDIADEIETVMASLPSLQASLGVIGKVFFIGEKPGSGQTMKLANNFLSATAMVATSEAVVMGVKSGLDPAVMIDVINAGSGMNTASRDKFPRSVLPRTFDFGFATGLMVKDVRLAVE